MDKPRLQRQIGFFMAITFVLLEAALLMVQRLEILLSLDNSKYSREAKQHFNSLKDAWHKVRFHLEYFEESILPAMITSDGKSDTASTYDAMVEDGYDLARIACRIFNSKVSDKKGFSEIEEALKQFEATPRRIDEEVINTLKLQS